METIYTTLKVKDGNGDIRPIHIESSTNVIFDKERNKFLDELITDYENHIANTDIHLINVVSTGSNQALIVTNDPPLENIDNAFLLITLGTDIGNNATLKVDSFDAYNIITGDGVNISEGLKTGSILMVKYDNTISKWIAVNYHNKNTPIYKEYIATGSTNLITVQGFDFTKDKISYITFNQTILQPDIDFVIDPDGKVRLLDDFFLIAGEKIVVVYIKNLIG